MPEDLVGRYGSAKHPERPVAKSRPAGVDDATVPALGKLSEALEVVVNARGNLYEFHRMSSTADLALQETIALLRDAGHTPLADDLDGVLVGRGRAARVVDLSDRRGYDEQYYRVFKAVDEHARVVLAAGTRHLLEAEMKREEQTRARTPAEQ